MGNAVTKPRSHGRLSINAQKQPRELMQNRPQIAGAWNATVLTLYPEMFPGTLGQSLVGRALEEGIWALDVINIRNFAKDKHRTVDDTPVGGGAGMILKPDVLGRAIDDCGGVGPIIAPSPRGKPFTQQMAQELANKAGMTILCGRFEGIDQRVLDAYGIEEVSLGDYILTGGELAAQVLIDATVRLIPRVLGNQASTEHESFSDGLLEHPHYTRPTEWAGRKIPEVLLSGHHGQIAEWRQTQAEALTQQRRPDLWRAYLDKSTDPKRDQEHSGSTAQKARDKKDDV